MDNENQRELDVLAALEGIHRMQESIRDTELDIVVETGIIFLRLHYQRLPPGVARRLTEISPRDVAEVSEVIRENGATPSSGEAWATDWRATQPSPRSSGRRMSTGIGWATARSSRRWRRERAEGWGDGARREARRRPGRERDRPIPALPGREHQQGRPRGAAQAHGPPSSPRRPRCSPPPCISGSRWRRRSSRGPS